jgi:uncharacterized damage-inducible protein DinB
MPINAPLVHNDRESLLGFLAHQRHAVRYAAYGLSDDQARRRPAASQLSLGGLVKHLLYGERNWADRMAGLPAGEAEVEAYLASFVLRDDETLAGVLDGYRTAWARTDQVLAGIDDLERRIPLPAAPWYPDPEKCTVRWILLHLIEETARHAGHADMLREALDGAQSGPLMAAAEGWPDDGWIKPWRPPS